MKAGELVPTAMSLGEWRGAMFALGCFRLRWRAPRLHTLFPVRAIRTRGPSTRSWSSQLVSGASYSTRRSSRSPRSASPRRRLTPRLVPSFSSPSRTITCSSVAATLIADALGRRVTPSVVCAAVVERPDRRRDDAGPPACQCMISREGVGLSSSACARQCGLWNGDVHSW